MVKMVDIPEYTIKPNVLRKATAQLLLMIVLSIVFYFGIYINIYLLNIQIPQNIQILIITVLGLLVMIQVLLTYVQTSKIRYSIYRNRVQIETANPKYLMFNTIQDIQIKKNIFDNIFKTGTIILQPELKLEFVPNIDQTYSYLKQMIQYSRTQYNQM
jgi:hypothetical protein